MEEENIRRETRQRSRSKTPLTLRSSVDRDVGVENDKKKSPNKKNPTIETILEESPAIPLPRTTSTRPKRNAAKTITSDYSSDDGSTDSGRLKDTAALIANSVAVVPKALEQNITKTTTIITTKTIKTAASEQLPVSQVTKTDKTSVATRSLNREINQNDSNTLFEQNLRLRTSTPRGSGVGLNSSSANSSYSDTSINNGVNLEEHPPFKEYKEAGEYWNKYPKTDYTYSKLSPHRRELAPGLVAMPNMSRRSLEHHNERVNIIAKTDPQRASFLRSRYESFTTRSRPTRAADTYYDSQDETDLSNGKRYYYSSATSQSWIRRLITFITTIISNTYYGVTDVFRPSTKRDLYYSRLDEEKQGIIRRIGSSITNAVVNVFRYIYIGISSVLLLDSWLLRSKNPSGGKKKGFMLLLLVLFPLLLLSGTYYYLDKPAPIPNLNINLFTLDQLIDPKLYNNVKLATLNNYNNVLNISSDYWLYLKNAAQNSANEAHKLWRENFFN